MRLRHPGTLPALRTLALTLICSLFLIELPAALPAAGQGKPDPAAPVAASASQAARLVAEGRDLYRQGKPGEALVKYEAAVAQGASGGELFYQMGYCYKSVRQDLESSRQYMKKAIPLLEAMPESDFSRYYYLSASYLEASSDAAASADTAQKGLALIENGSIEPPAGGEGLFQVATLYTRAGQPDKAVSWYEKAVAALDDEKNPNQQYLVAACTTTAQYYKAKKQYADSARWYERLLEIDPARSQDRMVAGFVLLNAADYEGAIEVLRGFTDDDAATQANYLIAVTSRYVSYGKALIDPNAPGMDEAALQEALLASARKLGDIRKKDEETEQKLDAEWDKPLKVVKTKSGKTYKVYTQIVPPAEEVIPKDPNHPTGEEQQRMFGITYAPTRPPSPLSPERVAAEKEFLGYMIEYVKRGHLLQEFAMTKGLTALIFR